MNINLPEMDLRLKPGEIMLYVDLHRLESHKPGELLNWLAFQGLEPELRYRVWTIGEDTFFGLYAVIHREKREYDSALEESYFLDEVIEQLQAMVTPSIAVHFVYRLRYGRESIAA